MANAPEIHIQKFGGSSVATPARLTRVAELVRESLRPGRPAVVVVSSMGKTTDALLALADSVTARSDGTPASAVSEPDRREVDQLLATGETVSVALLALALRRQGIPAVSLTGEQAGIQTAGEHGRGIVASIDTDRIRRHLAAGTVVVVAGFQGVAANGDVMTLGRGGSDTTAVALASALGQDVCHIYTDVDGVYTSDPRTIPAARRLPLMDLGLLIELSHAGAQVVHTRAAELAASRVVDLHVASTFATGPEPGPEPGGSTAPGHTGETLEVGSRVVAVAGDRNLARVSVTGTDDRRLAPAVFRVLAGHGVPIDHVGMHRDVLTFTVSRADLRSVRACLAPVLRVFRTSLAIDEHLGKVSLVGRRLLGDAGCAARMLAVLANKEIQVDSLVTSQFRISALVRIDALTTATQALHDEFNLDRSV